MTGYTFSQLIDFTRTSAATFVNSSGNIASTPQSRNLLTFTQEFANAAWTKTNATISANSVAAPDGTMTADTLTASAGNGTVLQTFTASAVPYTFSIWLRRLTGTGNVQLTVDGTTFATVAVTSEWTRFSTTLTPSAGSRTAGVRIVTSGDAVYGWGAQLEAASAATDYTRNFGGLFPPRFDYDPVTRAPRGLLIEEQRTNLLLRSEEFDNASWVKQRSSVTANATTSPDGTVDADKLVEDTTASDTHFVLQTATVSSSTTYTYSVYLKASERTRASLQDGGGSAAQGYFDLSNGTVISASGATATIANAGNGWYRCTITFTTGGAQTNANCRIFLVDTGTNTSYTGNGTSGIFLWGAQLEAGAFATSYIPTVASQVTRTADTAAINAPNFASWYNQSAGSFVIEFRTVQSATALARNIVGFDSSNSKLVVYIASSGTQAGTWDGSAAVTASGSVVSGTPKVAMAYSTSARAITTNGGTVATGAAPAAGFTASTSLNIGGTTGSGLVNGYIRSLRYYPVRLTNAQLQALTA